MIPPLRLAKVAIALTLMLSILTNQTTDFILSVIVAYLFIDVLKTAWRMFNGPN
jgi:hypothetical protein